MTIQALQQHLNIYLAQWIQKGEFNFSLAEPRQLIKSTKEIEQKFGELANKQPDKNTILNAVEKLEREGVNSLSRREWRHIAWGLCWSFPQRPQKLVFLAAGAHYLNVLRSKDKEFICRLYPILLFSYFSLDKKEFAQNHQSFLVLRDLLASNFNSFYQSKKIPTQLMQTLNEHQELLKKEPTKKIAMLFIDDVDEQKIPALTKILNIPNRECWFWYELMKSAIQNITLLSDDIFKEKIHRFLNILEKNPIYTDAIIIALLERYATAKFREQADEHLKKVALDKWGTPQFDDSIKWQKVKPDTKQMVAQWFVRADLEAFFRLFSYQADEDRFNFWIRYLKQIKTSLLFFGSGSIHSNQFQQRKFLEQNKGRYSELKGSKSSTNAFMIQIGNMYIVEFSETGNACYFHHSKPPLGINTITEQSVLKSRKVRESGNALSHIPPSPAWEKKFHGYLKEFGVFPDSTVYRK